MPSTHEPQPIDSSLYADLAHYCRYASSAYTALCPRPNGQVLVGQISNAATDIQGFVARDDERREIVVALRGSLSATDILLDTQLALVPLVAPGVRAPADARVHSGFLAGWNSVAPEVYALVAGELQRLRGAWAGGGDGGVEGSGGIGGGGGKEGSGGVEVSGGGGGMHGGDGVEVSGGGGGAEVPSDSPGAARSDAARAESRQSAIGPAAPSAPAVPSAPAAATPSAAAAAATPSAPAAAAPYALVATGHSLGGALATLAAVALRAWFAGEAEGEEAEAKGEVKGEREEAEAEAGPHARLYTHGPPRLYSYGPPRLYTYGSPRLYTHGPPRLYTYGAPRAGNRAFAEFVNGRLGRGAFRVVHARDGVPTMIPTALGYSHHGIEYWQRRDPPCAENTVRCSRDGEDAQCSASVPSGGINEDHLWVSTRAAYLIAGHLTDYYSDPMATYFSLKDIASAGRKWVDNKLLDRILDAAVLRRDAEGRFELIIGFGRHDREAKLLITDDEYWRLPRHLTGGRPPARLGADYFACLAPAACARADLQAALKGKGGGGGSYLLLEHARALDRVLRDPGAAGWLGIPCVEAGDVRLLAFAYNLVYTEQSEEAKRAQPKIKDVGLVEADAARGWAVREGSARHILHASNVGLQQVEQDPQAFGLQREERLVREEFEGTQTLPQDHFDLAPYFDVSGRDARPIILLVSNVDYAIAVLNSLGVDTKTWKGKGEKEDQKRVLEDLLGKPSKERRLQELRSRSRSPRREHGTRAYDDRPRRGRSPDRGWAHRQDRGGHSHSLQQGVYVVDIKEAFSAYHASFTDASGVRRMAHHAGLVQDHRRWCAGVEAKLLVDLWRTLISMPSVGFPKRVRDEAWNRHKASLLAASHAAPAVRAQETAGDGDESDDDLNAGPPVTAVAVAGPGPDPYLDDFSDHGDSDDDDNDD